MFRKFQKLFAALMVASFMCSINVAGNGVNAASIDVPRTVQSADYGKMPVLFEQNKGQTDSQVKFVSRGPGYTLYLTDKGAEFSLKSESAESKDSEIVTKDRRAAIDVQTDTLKMQFVNANSNPVITGGDAAITKTNYYIGRRRIENVSNYKRVNYKNIYHGIDAVFYGNKNNQLEYDFVVAPNTDASQISLRFDDAKTMLIDDKGNLVIKTDNTELIQQKPFAYQTINGDRKEVAVSYKLTDKQISFELGEYDKSQTLVIDPVLNYLTYIGGTAFDDPFEIAADAQGNAYASGKTNSLNFHGDTRAADDDTGVFVVKINAAGDAFAYVTILEGNKTDLGLGIAVNANGEAFVVGQATRDFPVTDGAFDRNLGGQGDGFAAKLNADGTLDYATYIGGGAGDDVAFDVAVDSGGKAYVTGRTVSGLSFPQKDRYQGCGAGITFNSYDAYLTVVNAAGTDITYSTCIGGNLTADQAFSVALDSSNNAYIIGDTEGENFPTKSAFQPDSGGGKDAFVAKFNPASSGEASLIYSTYLGGAGTEFGNGIAINSSGQAVVVGVTGSTNFPLANAFDSTNVINEAYVSVISSSGTSLVNSSFLGGADRDEGINVALGVNGLIYVVGTTLSNDFPVALAFQATRAGLRDAFVTKLKFGVGVISSSYLGGSGNDAGDGIAVKGNFIYVVGSTESTNLATTAGTIKQTSNASATNPDAFVAKILDTRLDSVGVFRPNSTFVLTQSITNVVPVNATFTGALTGARGVSGDFNGDGIDTTGSFTDGVWKVRNSNFPVSPLLGAVPTTFNFGLVGDLPVVGDWDGDGVDTAGTFRPSTGQFFLTNSPTAAFLNNTQQFGLAGDLPIAGDWDGDGIDTLGVFRPSTSQIFLTNSTAASPTIDFVTVLGLNGDLPIAGDFNGDGIDSIGLWRPSTTEFFITNNNVNLLAQFPFGASTDQPIIGDWDGRPLP